MKDTYLITTDIDGFAESTSRPRITRDPALLKTQLVVPEWTWRVSQFRRVSNPPCPEEPVLQGIHIGLDIHVNSGFSRSVPVEPFFPLFTGSSSGGLVRGVRVDAVEPFTAVVDRC